MVFIRAPILIHPKFVKAFYLETHALDFAIEVVFLQISIDEKVYPFAFYSQKFFPKKINYKIHDIELLAIVDFFQE